MGLSRNKYDVCISGAGIIGLSIASELNRRGAKVLILEAGAAISEASVAAAGMLADQDPENHPGILPLAQLSIALYPTYLSQISTLSSRPLSFQTHLTLQSFATRQRDKTQRTSPTITDAAPHARFIDTSASSSLPATIASQHPKLDFQLLSEHSIDPRELAVTLLAAVRTTTVDMLEHSEVISTSCREHSVCILTSSAQYAAARYIDCTGAWSSDPIYGTRPIKGQMIMIDTPANLDFTIRTPDIYLVPRLHGQRIGQTLIGATVEDVGFDKTTHQTAIQGLIDEAAALVPHLAATVRAAWAGLRPATSDGVPIIGEHPEKPNHFLATGHYRNGILLAPATANVMADLLDGRPPSIDPAAFSPGRFSTD